VAVGNIHGQGELLLEILAELPPDDTDEPLTPAPYPGPLGEDTLQIAVAGPPEPEPFSWVAPLETPAHGIHIPGRRGRTRHNAHRNAHRSEPRPDGSPAQPMRNQP
jgi:hypothetical protein